MLGGGPGQPTGQQTAAEKNPVPEIGADGQFAAGHRSLGEGHKRRTKHAPRMR